MSVLTPLPTEWSESKWSFMLDVVSPGPLSSTAPVATPSPDEVTDTESENAPVAVTVAAFDTLAQKLARNFRKLQSEPITVTDPALLRKVLDKYRPHAHPNTWRQHDPLRGSRLHLSNQDYRELTEIFGRDISSAPSTVQFDLESAVKLRDSLEYYIKQHLHPAIMERKRAEAECNATLKEVASRRQLEAEKSKVESKRAKIADK